MGDLEKFKQFVSSDTQYGIDLALTKDDVLDDIEAGIDNKELLIGISIGLAFKQGNKKIINLVNKLNGTEKLCEEIT